ncbi:MAG: hypothetical protein KAI72_01065, partial [Candidatus Pacebacteria bacterium]|nr:hypothetical protein [Candidatus Paceibacterota bacterium]
LHEFKKLKDAQAMSSSVTLERKQELYNQLQERITNPGTQMDQLKSMLIVNFEVIDSNGNVIKEESRQNVSYNEYKKIKLKAEKNNKTVSPTGFMFNEGVVGEYKVWLQKELNLKDGDLADIEKPNEKIGFDSLEEVFEYRRSLKAVAKVILQLDGTHVGFDDDSAMIRPAPGSVVTPELQLSDPYFAGHTQLLFGEMKGVETAKPTDKYMEQLKNQKQQEAQRDEKDEGYADNLHKVTVSDWARVTTMDKSIRRVVSAGGVVSGFTGTYDAVTDMAFKMFGLRHKYMGNRFNYEERLSAIHSTSEHIGNLENMFIKGVESTGALENIFKDIAGNKIKNGYILNGIQTLHEGPISEAVINGFKQLIKSNPDVYAIDNKGNAEINLVVKDQKTGWNVLTFRHDRLNNKATLISRSVVEMKDLSLPDSKLEYVSNMDDKAKQQYLTELEHELIAQGYLEKDSIFTDKFTSLENSFNMKLSDKYSKKEVGQIFDALKQNQREKFKTAEIEDHMVGKENVFFYLNPSATRATDIKSVHGWLEKNEAARIAESGNDTEKSQLKSDIRSQLKNYALVDEETTSWVFLQLAGRDRGARDSSGNRDSLIFIDGQKIYHNLDVYVIDNSATANPQKAADHKQAVAEFNQMLNNADTQAKQKAFYKNLNDIMYSRVAEYFEDLKSMAYQQVGDDKGMKSWLADTQKQVKILEKYLGEFQNTTGVDDSFTLSKKAANSQETLQQVVNNFRKFLKEKVVGDQQSGLVADSDFGLLSKEIRESLTQEANSTQTIDLKSEVSSIKGGVSFGSTVSETVNLINSNIKEDELPARVTDSSPAQDAVFVSQEWDSLASKELSDISDDQKSMIKKKLIDAGFLGVGGKVSSSGVGFATHAKNAFNTLNKGMMLSIIQNMFKGSGTDDEIFSLVESLTSNNVLSLGYDNFEAVFTQLRSASDLMEKGIIDNTDISANSIVNAMTSFDKNAFLSLLADNAGATSVGQEFAQAARKYVDQSRKAVNSQIMAETTLSRLTLYKDAKIEQKTLLPMRIGGSSKFVDLVLRPQIDKARDIINKMLGKEVKSSSKEFRAALPIALVLSMVLKPLIDQTFGNVVGAKVGLLVIPLYIAASAFMSELSVPVQKQGRKLSQKLAGVKLQNAQQNQEQEVQNYINSVMEINSDAETKNSMLSFVKPTKLELTVLKDILLNTEGLSEIAKGLTSVNLLNFHTIAPDKQEKLMTAIAGPDNAESFKEKLADFSKLINQATTPDKEAELMTIFTEAMSQISVLDTDAQKLTVMNWFTGMNFTQASYQMMTADNKGNESESGTEAISNYEKVLEAEDATPTQMARASYNLGMIYSKKAKENSVDIDAVNETAIEKLQDAIKYAKGNVELSDLIAGAYTIIGDIHRDKASRIKNADECGKSLDDAAGQYNKALAEVFGHVGANFGLGLVNMERGDFDQAIASF